MKITTIIGARPQFVKAAVVSRAFREHRPDVQEIIIHTGQHYDANMSDVFFDELDIPRPNHHLGIGGGTHGQNTGRMIEAVEAVLLDEKPDWVLVYGDTDSTLAGALAAAKLHIPVAHVEAGLRSFNRTMPEELNRILTDHVSSLLFTPTDTATRNLANEGIMGEKVQQVGDVMYDAAIYYAEKAHSCSKILSHLNLVPKNYILATVHRAENTDNSLRLQAIVQGLLEAAKERTVVMPLHPRTREALKRENLFTDVSSKLYCIEPVGYMDMIMLEQNACLIATDSGGIQKEAYFHKVPCITLRSETEWSELVECGWNRLINDTSDIKRMLYEEMKIKDSGNSLYGNGDTGMKIANSML
jgi:UDP-GlcNAc3NAcA epimerase